MTRTASPRVAGHAHLDAAYNLSRSLTRNDDAVDHHLEAVFAELGVGSRTQAATVAVTTGPLETCRQPQSED